MKKCCLLVIGLALSSVALSSIALSSQAKPIIVVKVFTTAPDVTLPYDMKLLQTQLVAEFKSMLGKEFDVVTENPKTPPPQEPVYTLGAEITAWRAGNAAKRIFVGFGSGRESMEIQYQVTDGSDKRVLERKDTIRTNFFSQGAGSTGTLSHPIAQRSPSGSRTPS